MYLLRPAFTAVFLLLVATTLGRLSTSALALAQDVVENPFELLPSEPVHQDEDAERAQPANVPAGPDADQADADQNEADAEPENPPPPAEQRPRAAAEVAPAAEVILKAEFSTAALIDVDGPIFGALEGYVERRLDWAEDLGADLVIVRLTSPGGDMETSLRMARRLRDIDWAATIVFIPEEAISGGAIVALGADRIFMRPGSLFGDAGPIQLGRGGQFEHAPEKIVSYLAAAIAEIAAAKNRSPALCEAMVDRSLKVFEVEALADGAKRYLKATEVADPNIMKDYRLVAAVAETQEDRFLTLKGQRAAELNLCEGLFASEQEMLATLTIDTLVPTRMTWVDHTLAWLNAPWLTALLLIIGLIGLYLEMAAPGLSVAGLTSAVAFGIFFWSHFLGGTAGWLEVVLFVLGIVCIACELFVLPGFGLFGVSGIGLVVVALVMASQDFVVPNTASQWQLLKYNTTVVLGSVLGVLVLLAAQILFLDSLPGLNRFQLGTPDDIDDAATNAPASLAETRAQQLADVSVGSRGISDSVLRPSGKVLFSGQIVDVVTEGDFVDADTEVEVVRIEGNRIVVRRKQ